MTLKARPAIGMMALVLVNVALVGIFGWRWSQGDPSPAARILTVVPGILLVLKIYSILHPPTLRLSDERVFVQVSWIRFSTPRENVALLEIPAGRLLIRFDNLSKVEAGATTMKFMEQNRSQGRPHFSFPMRADAAEFQRFREAVFQGRT